MNCEDYEILGQGTDERHASERGPSSRLDRPFLLKMMILLVRAQLPQRYPAVPRRCDQARLTGIGGRWAPGQGSDLSLGPDVPLCIDRETLCQC